MKPFILYTLLALTATACSSDHEELPDVMSRDAFVALLIDMERTEAFATLLIVENRAGRDEIYQLYKQVFEKHNIDEKMFERTMLHYSANRQLLHDIYNQVLDSLSENLPSGVYGEPDDQLLEEDPSTPKRVFDDLR
jgi:hypothetical protein